MDYLRIINHLPAIITVAWHFLVAMAAKKWNGNYSSRVVPIRVLYPLLLFSEYSFDQRQHFLHQIVNIHQLRDNSLCEGLLGAV